MTTKPRCPHCDNYNDPKHNRKFLVEIRWRDIRANPPEMRKRVVVNPTTIWTDTEADAVNVIGERAAHTLRMALQHFWQKFEAEVVDVTDDRSIHADYGWHI